MARRTSFSCCIAAVMKSAAVIVKRPMDRDAARSVFFARFHRQSRTTGSRSTAQAAMRIMATELNVARAGNVGAAIMTKLLKIASAMRNAA